MTHPILLPTWMFLIFIVTGVCRIYHINELIYLGIVFLTTFIVPIIIIFLTKKLGMIHSFLMESREERLIPILIVTVFMFPVSSFFKRIPGLSMYYYFIQCSIILSFMTLLVSMRWKVSLHTTGWGCFTAFLMIMTKISMKVYLPFFIASILLSGIIASARLYLKSHNDAQIYVGFAMGFILVFVMSFLFLP